LFRCYSYIGRQGGAQSLSIGTSCETVGIVEHEIMHALGFYHEHSRPDRDDHVIIIDSNIQTGKDHFVFSLLVQLTICDIIYITST